MNSQQYEELCRFFLSQVLGIDLSQIKSGNISNPTVPDSLKYKHQIDLYWETRDEIALYFNIANAKWRSTDKVDQGEVLLLQKVRDDIHAHKAIMITNTNFTRGARAVAENQGIALHIVCPTFDYVGLHTSDRAHMQNYISQAEMQSAKPIYSHQVVYRAFDVPSSTQNTAERTPYENRMLQRVPKTKRVSPSPASKKSSPQTIQRIIPGHRTGTQPQTIQRVIRPTNRQVRGPDTSKK
jgi:hypothetical protein